MSVNCGIFESGSDIVKSDFGLFLKFMKCVFFTDRTFLEIFWYLFLVKTYNTYNHYTLMYQIWQNLHI